MANTKTAAASKKPAAKTASGKAPAAHVEAGPRGFRFGHVFIQSVIDGAGVAAAEKNRLKLIAFAKEIGADGIGMKTDLVEALKKMHKGAQKYFNEHYETA